MLNIEIMEQNKAIQLYSGPDKGFVMTSLFNGVLSNTEGCYTKLIEKIEDFHWTHAELFGKEEMVCFFSLGTDEGIAVSGTRELGPEHKPISRALRAFFSREYEKFSDETKETVDVLLEDYKENGCRYRPGFPIIYYDDDTTIEKLSPEQADRIYEQAEHSLQKEVDLSLDDSIEFYTLMKKVFAEHPIEQIETMKPEQIFFKPAGFLLRTQSVADLAHFMNSHNLSFHEEETLECFYNVKEEFLREYTNNEKKPSLDSLISQANAISEQAKKLSDNLQQHKTELEH